jgi:hypothetical protein
MHRLLRTASDSISPKQLNQPSPRNTAEGVGEGSLLASPSRRKWISS